MPGPMLRRSLLSLFTLAGILVGIGGVVVWLGVSFWVPLIASLAVVGLQYWLGPRMIEWLVPAYLARPDRDSYAKVSRMVAQRSEEAGLHGVKLGIVDDGTPNAFTFGHHRGDARIWVTVGLIERLDDDELDAVIAHEVSHIVHGDFIVMTFASVVPVLAYYVFLGARTQKRADGLVVTLGAYAVYLASSLVVLGLARSRELAADRRSCEVTGHGDALCSALVKIGYGMGEVKAQRAAEARRSIDDAKGRRAFGSERRQLASLRRRNNRRDARIRSVGGLGIADPAQAGAILLAHEEGIDERHILGALRWDSCNPWARFQELFSSHPVVVHRIGALERSGLPGAPRDWSATEVERSCDGPELSAARRRFALELALRYLGWAALLVATIAAHSFKDWDGAGWALMIGGGVLLVKYLVQHPLRSFSPIERVTSLAERLDASPVRGIPVILCGRIIGRASPGYVLSADLVLQDGSGFVPIRYRQPVPLSRALFGALRAGEYAGRDVTVRGWYRRAPTPFVELRDITSAATRSRCWQWIAGLVFAPVVVLVGLGIVLAH